MNNSKYLLIIITTLNAYFLYILKLSFFDQILNIMICFAIYNHYKECNFLLDRDINKSKFLLFFCIIIFILYRSYWLHTGDNFIYLLLPSLLFSFSLISKSAGNLILNLRPFFISLFFPISKILFIPLSIIITPFSTLFTWLSLNTFGFYSIIKGQQIYYSSPGIDVTFSCSGSGQIIFCLIAMSILHSFFPLKNTRLFLIQLSRAFLFTFFANVVRLFILTIYSYTYDNEGFSVFRYLHSGDGGLLFSFFSILLSCESYKRLYFKSYKLQ